MSIKIRSTSCPKPPAVIITVPTIRQQVRERVTDASSFIKVETTGSGADKKDAAAITAVVMVVSPNSIKWVSKLIDAEEEGFRSEHTPCCACCCAEGMQDTVLAPGEVITNDACSGCWCCATAAPLTADGCWKGWTFPSAWVRDWHYKLCVGWLSRWLASSFCGSIFTNFFGWILLLSASMVVDTAQQLLIGPLAILEVTYLVLRYGVITSEQLVQAAAAKAHARFEAGDKETGIEFNLRKSGQHSAAPIHLMVPAVNSFTIAASTLLSGVLIYLEWNNVVTSLPDETEDFRLGFLLYQQRGEGPEHPREHHRQYTAFGLMAVQFAFNSTATQTVYAAADLADEKKVESLQRTGALPDSRGEQSKTRSDAIKAASDA
jgi:hypothetical protein